LNLLAKLANVPETVVVTSEFAMTKKVATKVADEIIRANEEVEYVRAKPGRSSWRSKIRGIFFIFAAIVAGIP
jgi:hypothetical protein